jgi:hypothetical protein
VGRRRAQTSDLRQLLAMAERSVDSIRQIKAMMRLLRFYIEVERYQQAERLAPRLRVLLPARRRYPTPSTGLC